MKILEVCPYSAGGCGVWARVRQESELLVKKGHEVYVFSSNFEKGTDKIVPSEEILNGVKIKRFQAKKLGGESFMFWNFIHEAVMFSPDRIIVHNYRHLHTTMGLKVAKTLRRMGREIKIFLVTHAPFVEGNITRTNLETFIVSFYDFFVGRFTLNKFDKIFPISHWEIPFLLKLGVQKKKIVYIPNGIPPEFFSLKKQAKEENKILFLARISPKKKVVTLVSSISFLKDKKIKIEIVGPVEESYFETLKKLISDLNVASRITFSKPIYDLRSKIKKIDSCKIYILPSRVEGMPQSLIEVMARGKIVIGSNSLAIRDLIKDKRNGYLFEFDNPRELARVIDEILSTKNQNFIKNNAKKFVKNFSWDRVINKIEKEIA